MARFEKERDPMEIQEKLSLSAAETSKSDALSDPINPREEHAENDSRSSGGRNSDNKTSKRFRPYSTSSPLQASRSMLSEEKTMKSAPGYKVFVANLAFTTTEKMVESHMARVGSVLKALLFRNPNGSSKGMGIVQYRNEESIDRAVVELRDSELDGRRIYVRKHMEEEEREKCGIVTINRPIDRPRPPANPSATVFINNLDYSCTWQQIKDVFKAAGKIVYCEVQLDKEGRSKGMASVQYERPIEALNAIALFHGQVLFNRALMVRMDNRSPIKPDSMTIKQVFGGGLNMMNPSAAVALIRGGVSGLGMSLLGLSASLGLSPDLLQSLGVGGNGQNIFAGLNLSNGGYFPNPDEDSSLPSSDTRSQTTPLLPSPLFSLLKQQSSLSDEKSNGIQRTNNSSRHPLSNDCNFNKNHASDGEEGQSPPPMSSATTGGAVVGLWKDPDFLYTKPPSPNERRVMVKNLNFKTPWQKLKDLFRGAGRVQFVDMMQGPDGRPNGNAFVLFDRPEEASRSVEMFHNSELDGRKIEVQIDRFSTQ